jgi:Flp pilus assembly protein TadB
MEKQSEKEGEKERQEKKEMTDTMTDIKPEFKKKKMEFFWEQKRKEMLIGAFYVALWIIGMFFASLMPFPEIGITLPMIIIAGAILPMMVWAIKMTVTEWIESNMDEAERRAYKYFQNKDERR